MAVNNFVPISDDAVMWDRTGGPGNYSTIDEYPSWDSDDYNYTSENNENDQFNFDFSAIPSDAIINYVRIYVYKMSPTTANSGVFYVKWGNFLHYMDVDIDWGEEYWEMTVNPITGLPWQRSDLFVDCAGYGNDYSGYTFRVSRLYIEVSYNMPPAPSVPTNEEIMRHLKWFHGGANKGCYLGWR